MRTRSALTVVATAVAASVLLPFGPAHAVDGVIEIDQSRANAGGVTPGDTPGMPVTISVSGSYRLTSNLSGSPGIEVSFGLDEVSIDLGGFTVDGGGGSGIGVRGRARAAVRNGIVRNFPTGPCIQLDAQSRVTNVRTAGCNFGILVGDHSLVRGSTARSHAADGINAGIGARIRENVAELNGDEGIAAGVASVAIGNLSRANSGNGVAVGDHSVARENQAGGNFFGVTAGLHSVVRGNLVASNSQPGMSVGDDSVISGTASADNARGINCGDRCVVLGNTANGSANVGIGLGDGSAAIDNVASDNGNQGLDCASGTDGSVCGIVGNTLISNVSWGLRLPIVAIQGQYKDNTITESTGPDVAPSGLDPGFRNTCSGTTPCP